MIPQDIQHQSHTKLHKLGSVLLRLNALTYHKIGNFLLTELRKALTKRLQNFNPTYRNTFAYVWLSCCDLLRHVGCCWLKFETGQTFHATFVDVGCCSRATVLRPCMCTSSIYNSQHVATRCNRVAKRAKHVAPNNVAICSVQVLGLFGRAEHANSGPTNSGQYVVLIVRLGLYTSEESSFVEIDLLFLRR